MTTEGRDDSTPIGLYGKVGSQPDFLRANAGEFSQCGLDRLLQDAMEALRGERAELPEPPTAFLFSPAGPLAFVGTFAPSKDSAGRSFPLAVFSKIATARLVDDPASVLAAHTPFLQAAGALAFTGGDGVLSGPDLLARAHALPVPPLSVDGAASPAWLDQPATGLHAAFENSATALGYALRTISSACDQAVKGGGSGRANAITVDAPAPSTPIREWWIELVRRRLKWRDTTPSLMWTDGPGGRLLITLGHPTPGAFSYLCNPRHRAAKFWPLGTTVLAAIDNAVNSLTPDQRRRVQSPNCPLGELLASFTT
jgi:type VI secretion system protein ImpM